jgi:hypothetical protein
LRKYTLKYLEIAKETKQSAAVEIYTTALKLSFNNCDIKGNLTRSLSNFRHEIDEHCKKFMPKEFKEKHQVDPFVSPVFKYIRHDRSKNEKPSQSTY